MLYNAVFIVSLFIVHFLKCSYQQTIKLGKCPEDLKVVENFDIAQYTGVWYEQYRYFISAEIGYTCPRVNYTPTEEGPLKYSAISYSSWKERYVARSGIVKIDGPQQSKLLIEYPNRENAPVMHWILDTDYKSYTVVWSCRNGNRGFHFKSIWVYTREQHASEEILNDAIKALKNNNISPKLLTKTDQSNCCKCEVEEELPNKKVGEKSREEIEPNEDNGVDEIENLKAK